MEPTNFSVTQVGNQALLQGQPRMLTSRLLDGGWLVHCPKCAHVVSGRREGQAIQALADHIVTFHWPAWVQA